METIPSASKGEGVKNLNILLTSYVQGSQYGLMQIPLGPQMRHTPALGNKLKGRLENFLKDPFDRRYEKFPHLAVAP